MEELFYFVTHSDAWVNDLQNYHYNYFIEERGFTELLLIAAAIGAVVAAIFYFGFCNSNQTCKHATIANWFICMIVAAIVAFGYSDLITIGHNANDDGVSTGFYQSNEDYYNDICQHQQSAGLTNQDLNNLADRKNAIANDLNNYEDVRLPLDFTAAFYAVLSFFLISCIIKRFTINGKTIPFARP